MTTNDTTGINPKYTTALTAEELDFYKTQMQIELEKYKFNNVIWPSTIRQLPFKEVRISGEQVLETRCTPNELKDYFVLGNTPQEGHTYSLVCVKVIDDNGQIVARFKLV